MADGFGSMAGRAAGKVAFKSLFNPSTDIVKAIPQGIIELGLRGLAVILALFALIAAAVCQVAIPGNTIIQQTVPSSQTDSACGWVIFLSFWVMLYQILAIVQLFVRMRIVYKITIPVIAWSLFFMWDIIAIGIAAGGYFCGALPMAVYAGQWGNFGGVNGTASIASSASATTAFSFLSLFLFLGMITYFFVARYMLRWSTHGEDPPTDGYHPTDDNRNDD